jgi:hypothetical protein
MLETPPRKRLRSETPASSARPRHQVNKRFCPRPRSSPSPRTVRFEASPTDDEAIAESDVPESPIPNKRPNLDGALLSVSLLQATPWREINAPFEKLNIKPSTQKKSRLVTPVRDKGAGETSRSGKKSVKKTPGSAKANKPQPFRIKVASF